MKLAIDSYCYHRYFGEFYEGLQEDIQERRTVWQILDRAKRLGCAGISLESCYLPAQEPQFREELKGALQRKNLEAVWAWGHPNGLYSGTNAEAEADLVRHIEYAREIGAKVMRIVGGSWRTKPPRWNEHRRLMLAALKRIIRHAERGWRRFGSRKSSRHDCRPVTRVDASNQLTLFRCLFRYG
jgi:sugar phosphate isomerase/epimerase